MVFAPPQQPKFDREQKKTGPRRFFSAVLSVRRIGAIPDLLIFEQIIK